MKIRPPDRKQPKRRPRTSSPSGSDRRQFLLRAAKTAGGILLADFGPVQRSALAAPAVVSPQFTDWGWPQPYETVSKKSQDWLRSQGWWPLAGGWIVVWSGEELVGSIMQDQKLLEKRGLEVNWNTFVAAGYSNEAFIPGRLQLANTGALGVLVLLSNKVPMEALAVLSPALTHAAMVPLDSPLKSLSDLENAKVLGRPAVVGVTTGSTNHFGFIGAANYLGLRENRDYTLKSSPPGDLATAPKGYDVVTDWEPHVSYSTEVLKVTRLLESLNPYYIYSGYCYARGEIGKNAPDVMQAITDAYIESVLWARTNPDKAVEGLMSRSAYAHQKPELIKRMSELYFLWPKPTVYYPFKDRDGIWAREEARISAWAYQSGAIRTNVSVEDWANVRRPNYMDATFEKLGWRVPEWPAFLPKDFAGVGNLPYKPYGPDLLRAQVPFPEPGDLTKPWSFMGKTFHP